MDAVVSPPRVSAWWIAAGATWTLALLGLASIGLFVLPAALVTTAVAVRREGRRGVVGLLVGAAALAGVLLTAALLTA